MGRLLTLSLNVDVLDNWLRQILEIITFPCENYSVTALLTRAMSKGRPATLRIRAGLEASDPQEKPVLFIGRAQHLASLTFEQLEPKLKPRVNNEAWTRAILTSASCSGEAVEAWPRSVAVITLPERCSRHAAPSRAYAVARAAKCAPRASKSSIVLVCNKADVYASVCAIARSLPLFDGRSHIGFDNCEVVPTCKPEERIVDLEIVLIASTQEGMEGSDGDSIARSTCEYLQDATLNEEDIATLESVAASVRLAARISDMPTSHMNVSHFVQEAKDVASELNLPASCVTIIRGEDLRTRGLGGLYGVGRAATVPPALVVLSHLPSGADELPAVAWVGKGIVYDTGGLSIKARTSMVGMKRDCAGAAAVLGAFRSAVLAGVKRRLHAVLCLAENSVGPDATRPDDVHTLYSGHTVEINNTDAEGRLVLADGVAFAERDLAAKVIVDVATLTGAQGTATGRYHAALVTDSDAWELAAIEAGRRGGDLVTSLPYAPELHFPEFASTIADMKNSVADRSNAQPSCAGLFIKAQLGFDWPGAWLHVDMASPAICGERSTGYGVALLCVLFGQHAQNSALLRSMAPKQPTA